MKKKLLGTIYTKLINLSSEQIVISANINTNTNEISNEKIFKHQTFNKVDSFSGLISQTMNEILFNEISENILAGEWTNASLNIKIPEKNNDKIITNLIKDNIITLITNEKIVTSGMINETTISTLISSLITSTEITYNWFEDLYNPIKETVNEGNIEELRLNINGEIQKRKILYSSSNFYKNYDDMLEIIRNWDAFKKHCKLSINRDKKLYDPIYDFNT